MATATKVAARQAAALSGQTQAVQSLTDQVTALTDSVARLEAKIDQLLEAQKPAQKGVGKADKA